MALGWAVASREGRANAGCFRWPRTREEAWAVAVRRASSGNAHANGGAAPSVPVLRGPPPQSRSDGDCADKPRTLLHACEPVAAAVVRIQPARTSPAQNNPAVHGPAAD